MQRLVSMTMKLRTLVIGLLLANLLVAVWFVGFSQDNNREPERLQQQVRPQSVRVVPRQGDRTGDRSNDRPGNAQGNLRPAPSGPPPSR